MSTDVQIPKGYMQDANGNLVPIKLIKPIDLERDVLVKSLIERADKARRPLVEFKNAAEDEIADFIEHSSAQYGAVLGGRKGNVMLMSFDGLKMVKRNYGEQTYFDERIQAAKSIIDELIHEWAKGSRKEIKALVDHAFQTDKQGKISRERVLGLKKLNIDEPRWKQAMQAITDSLQVSGRKGYLTFYERDDIDAEWRRIAMDIASI